MQNGRTEYIGSQEDDMQIKRIENIQRGERNRSEEKSIESRKTAEQSIYSKENRT
jgi:hypothetical protein